MTPFVALFIYCFTLPFILIILLCNSFTKTGKQLKRRQKCPHTSTFHHGNAKLRTVRLWEDKGTPRAEDRQRSCHYCVVFNCWSHEMSSVLEYHCRHNDNWCTFIYQTTFNHNVSSFSSISWFLNLTCQWISPFWRFFFSRL